MGWSTPTLRRSPSLSAILANVGAHEFFHLWNVKRIRPQSLEPVDYTREMFTPALWFAEGVTNTYASYTLVRSGIWNSRAISSPTWAQQITELQARPARPWQSAEQSSLDTWFEKYPLYNQSRIQHLLLQQRPAAGRPLDILIRDSTDNRASLDDVLRAMNADFAREGKFLIGIRWTSAWKRRSSPAARWLNSLTTTLPQQILCPIARCCPAPVWSSVATKPCMPHSGLFRSANPVLPGRSWKWTKRGPPQKRVYRLAMKFFAGTMRMCRAVPNGGLANNHPAPFCAFACAATTEKNRSNFISANSARDPFKSSIYPTPMPAPAPFATASSTAPPIP